MSACGVRRITHQYLRSKHMHGVMCSACAWWRPMPCHVRSHLHLQPATALRLHQQHPAPHNSTHGTKLQQPGARPGASNAPDMPPPASASRQEAQPASTQQPTKRLILVLVFLEKEARHLLVEPMPAHVSAACSAQAHQAARAMRHSRHCDATTLKQTYRGDGNCPTYQFASTALQARRARMQNRLPFHAPRNNDLDLQIGRISQLPGTLSVPLTIAPLPECQ